MKDAITTTMVMAVFILAIGECSAQNQVAYCKHGQTGEVIVIEANHACPMGYYRI